MIGIYKITSPSKKIYVGQSKDIAFRWGDYRALRCKQQPRLFRSFNRYGVTNHIFEVLEECNVEDLNRRERYWQDRYKVLGRNGLNCVLQCTSDSKKEVSVETKAKIRHSAQTFSKSEKGRALIEERRRRLKGTLRSEEAKQKTSDTLRGMRKGIKHTEEHRKKLSEAKMGKRGALANKSRPITQFNSDGEFIKNWDSIQLAKESIGAGDIQSCLRGRQKTAGGFIWKYKN